MGYDTFNAFGCDYDAELVLAQARAMKDKGLVNAGYNFVILDDCYAERERNAEGYMVASECIDSPAIEIRLTRLAKAGKSSPTAFATSPTR